MHSTSSIVAQIANGVASVTVSGGVAYVVGLGAAVYICYKCYQWYKEIHQPNEPHKDK